MGKHILVFLFIFSFLASCSRGLASPSSSPLPSETISPISNPDQTPTISASPTPFSLPDLPTELLIQTQPEKCEGIGSSAYSEPPIDEAFYSKNYLSSLVLERGIIILVTNNSDEVNGDNSNVSALIQKPGIDGISLREALLAANNDPGEYTIRFHTSLQSATIKVGSWNHNELPPLAGGSTIINGDINGDGHPDITLENHVAQPGEQQTAFGMYIHSSNNTLYALKFVDFTNAIYFDAPFQNQIIAGNTLSRLVIQGGNGIVGGSGSDKESHNTWLNTKIIDNTFTAKGGISFGFSQSSGNRITDLTITGNHMVLDADDEGNVYDGIILSSGYGAASTGNEINNVVIANNTILGNPNSGIGLLAGFDGAGANSIHHVFILSNTVTLSQPDLLRTVGVQITAGYWVNQDGNSISDILIADNTIQGYQEAVFVISSGTVGSRWNRVERIRISNNHISTPNPVQPNGAPINSISIVTGDGATDYMDPNFQPVVYPDYNIVQDIWISGNVIEGQGGWAVSLGTGDPGAQHNQVKNVYILGNTIAGFYPGSGFMNAAVSLYLSGINDNQISQIFIQQNTILQKNLRDSFGGEEIVSGGILLTAGRGAEKNDIRDVWIVSNEISSPAPGISIVGGFSRPDMKVTQNNRITQVQVWCNSIIEKPVFLQALFPDVKGINLVGGYGLARNNHISNVLLYGNIVAGVENDVSVFQNIGDESEANTVDYQFR